jgi:hypothetical protein
MPSSTGPSSATNSSTPRMGILVDCQRFTAKVRQGRLPSTTKSVSRAKAPAGPGPRIPRPRATVGPCWFRPRYMVALGLGSLFFLSVSGGALYGFLTSTREPTISSFQHADTGTHDFQVAQKQERVPVAAAVKAPDKAAPKAPPKKDLASTPPALTLPITSLGGSGQTPPPVGATGPLTQDKSVKAEPVIAKEPPQKPVQEVAAKLEADTCSAAVCKGSGSFCGTAVTFLPSPKIAEEEAVKQHKLVFVLHVSGNFEDPGFT